MKKIVILSVFITLLIVVYGGNTVLADWWERPTARPTQPSIDHDRIPTTPPQPTQVVPPTTAPTTRPVQPTVTPTPRIGGPTSAPSEDGGEDQCASGESYTGPYCGWSPEKGKPSAEGPRIGGPEVLGLSYTSSGDLTISDIMLLTGVLCLALYARSKLSLVIRRL